MLRDLGFASGGIDRPICIHQKHANFSWIATVLLWLVSSAFMQQAFEGADGGLPDDAGAYQAFDVSPWVGYK